MSTSRNGASFTFIVSIGVAVLFLVVLGAAVLLSKVPPLVFGFYAVASLIAFVAYAVDKSAAKKGEWRVPESTLHLFAMAGGWPGALFAQQLLRHKSKKFSFRVVLWITVVLNCGVLIWLVSALGN